MNSSKFTFSTSDYCENMDCFTSEGKLYWTSTRENLEKEGELLNLVRLN